MRPRAERTEQRRSTHLVGSGESPPSRTMACRPQRPCGEGRGHVPGLDQVDGIDPVDRPSIPRRVLPSLHVDTDVGDLHAPGVGGPRRRTVPSFSATIATVTTAWIAPPSTCPVRPSTPDGMSTATTLGSPSRAVIAFPGSPRGSPENPVPKIASTTTSKSCSPTSGSKCTWGHAGHLIEARWCGKAPSASPTSNVTRHVTPSPSSTSRRAATKPSPPLLPVPQTTRALLP